MKKEDYLNSLVSHVKGKRNKQFILKEIGDHIDDEIEFYQSKGFDYETACEKAVNSMGNADLVGAQLGKLHSGILNKFLILLSTLILFVIYLVVFRYYLFFSPFFLNSGLTVAKVLTEFIFILISVISILTANRLKSRILLFVSNIFTLVYFLFNMFSLFSPILAVNYFVFTFKLTDYVNLCMELNEVSSPIMFIFSLIFYLAWFSAYIFAFINITKYNKRKYNFKNVNRERKFNIALLIVLIINIFSVSISTYAFAPKSVEDMTVSADSYYNGVMILESDTPCDIETLYNEEYYNTLVPALYINPDIGLYYGYNKWTEISDFYEKFSDDYAYSDEWKQAEGGFSYDVRTFYGTYYADKKYVSVIPYSFNSQNRKVIAFNKTQWYETDSTTEISGLLDTDELKSHYFKVYIANANQ